MVGNMKNSSVTEKIKCKYLILRLLQFCSNIIYNY